MNSPGPTGLHLGDSLRLGQLASRDNAGDAASRMRSRAPESDSVPNVTWIILGVASLIFGVAAFVSLKPAKLRESRGVDTALPADAEGPAGDPEPERSPLSITAELLDAESRSHLWNVDAVLGSIQTVIGPGGTKTPIEFEFGVAKGSNLPGAPLGAQRLGVLYSSGRAVQTPRVGKSGGLSSAPPNCPLEVAALKTPLGQLKEGSVAVLYSFSKKHGRAIWHFTDNSGSVHRIDGNSCAVLLH
jgi:hypothetical protein